jgi:hypothetical protein
VDWEGLIWSSGLVGLRACFLSFEEFGILLLFAVRMGSGRFAYLIRRAARRFAHRMGWDGMITMAAQPHRMQAQESDQDPKRYKWDGVFLIRLTCYV